MRRSSRGSVCRPWWSTRLRLTSKANIWLHKSCTFSVTQDNETKTTLSNVQMSWTLIAGLPRFRHAWNSQYSANINSFAVYQQVSTSVIFRIIHSPISVYHLFTTEYPWQPRLVSKRKFSSASTPNRRFVSNMFWWTSFFTIIIIIRWPIIMLSYYAGQNS